MRDKQHDSAAEKQRAYRERKRNAEGGSNVTGNVTDVTIEPKRNAGTVTEEWDREKYPNRKLWECAVERAARARRYAAKFGHLMLPREAVFGTVDWQYENESRRFRE